jgi:dTDP-4-amino-4,6-dideoxygalactose transaminase
MAMKDKVSRRSLLAASALAAAAPAKAQRAVRPGRRMANAWPVMGPPEEKALLDTLHSGHWGRVSGKRVSEFEGRYAALTGAKFCLATANGTSALICSMNALDVGPGDEVLLPPYTFVATLNVILLQHALPVFVDSDIESFQMDPAKIGPLVNANTRAVIPVHIGGSPADLDAIIPAARAKGIKVVEDACQAHLGEWRGKKLGTLGDCGCFSFQASKNLNSGEGGAFITDNEELMDRAYAFHSNGRTRRAAQAGFSYVSNGANLRLTEFQAALLMAQMTRIEEQSKTREQNAAHLSKLLSQIPGVKPAKLYPGCTRSAWHLYMFHYDSSAFGGAPRSAFLKALSAQGFPASGGYTPLNKEEFLNKLMSSRHYLKIFGEKRLKIWREQNQCPVNDRVCREAVWLTQTALLSPRSEMDAFAEAIAKLQKNPAVLTSA